MIMALKQPESMDDLLYFTRRTLEPKGRVMAWAFKKDCPECGKALMGKPVEKGKVKIRAKEYVCPSCGHVEDKAEHEKTVELNVQYTCPSCEHQGEATTPYKRKTFKGVKAFVVQCEECGEKIPVTKKMKEPKKKK